MNRLTEELHSDPFAKINFLCGALVPNGVVTKEESNQLAIKYTDLWIKHNVGSQKERLKL